MSDCTNVAYQNFWDRANAVTRGKNENSPQNERKIFANHVSLLRHLHLEHTKNTYNPTKGQPNFFEWARI